MTQEEFDFWYSKMGRWSFASLFLGIFLFGLSLTQYGGWIGQLLAGYWVIVSLVTHLYARNRFLRGDYLYNDRYKRLFFKEEEPNFCSLFFFGIFCLLWGFTILIGLVDPYLIPSAFSVLGWEIMSWVCVQTGILLIAIAVRV